jgi:hypothetical protein
MFRRLLVLALLCTGLLLGATSHAYAKGPTAASVTGPGLPRPLMITDRLADLMKTTGAEGLMFSSPSGLTFDRQAPSKALGPRYELRYMMGDRTVLEQHLYLSADGGPSVYTPPGQHNIFVNTEMEGGWRRLDDGGRRLLDEVGVPAVAAPADRPGEPVRPGQGTTVAGWGLLVSVVAAAGAVVWHARRRRLIVHGSSATP